MEKERWGRHQLPSGCCLALQDTARRAAVWASCRVVSAWRSETKALERWGWSPLVLQARMKLSALFE